MSEPPAVFDRYGRYYDLLNQDKNYEAEAAYIDRLLSRYHVAGKDLLEFGSGTGQHGRILAKHGYHVVGVERSAAMLAQAPAMDGFKCLHDDICTVQLQRTFDAVLALFHVLSYQVSNDTVQAVFARAAEHLRPGGMFIFDVWYSPAVHVIGPEVRVKRFADGAMELTRLAEPEILANENRVDVHYTFFARDLSSGHCETFTETHAMRHFSLPEIDLLAGLSGFTRVTAEEFMSGRMPGTDSWGLCVVLRRD